MKDTLVFFYNIIVPIFVSLIYFVLALYTKKIKPLRFFILGEKTYQTAFWIFLVFAIFLLGRPFQILSGNETITLIVSQVREFLMISILSPFLLVGILTHVFYDSRKIKNMAAFSFIFCLLLGFIYVYFNFKSINGIHFIFETKLFGVNIKAFDGNWFGKNNKYLPILFLIRIISPVLIFIFASMVAIFKAVTYPKNGLYNNLPKKYFLEGIAIMIFVLSMFSTGMMAYFWNFQSQWYYLGALIAGIIGFFALKLPPRDFMIKNDVK